MNEEKVPDRIRKLPVDVRGFPVPWFVHWDSGGVPDFRVIHPDRIPEAVLQKKCWTCGEKLGRFMTFVIGPMSAINRISSEPPSHLDCARYAATHCPFLTRPHMKRNVHNLPGSYEDLPGVALKRNPGVALLWVTKNYEVLKEGSGYLFRIGDPVTIAWYAEGRTATREEILYSIETGLPLLQEAAALDGPEALQALEQELIIALSLVPV
jgi:hypothetical protein